VEPKIKTLVIKRVGVVLLLSFFIISCIGARQMFQITDYILLPNGKEIVGQKKLTAFIFENNVKNLPIEKFLSDKFKSTNYLEKEFWITIDKAKYKIILYDYDEFEKYFNSANFVVSNQEPENSKNGNQRKFIAFSMINSYNEDCLEEHSLFQNIAVNYLKKLKDEYYNQ
jgi:hypothetical protein